MDDTIAKIIGWAVVVIGLVSWGFVALLKRSIGQADKRVDDLEKGQRENGRTLVELDKRLERVQEGVASTTRRYDSLVEKFRERSQRAEEVEQEALQARAKLIAEMNELAQKVPTRDEISARYAGVEANVVELRREVSERLGSLQKTMDQILLALANNAKGK